MTDLWTLAELVARAAVALGGTAEQASARVREIPDARTIRWYQTTGLIDRPLALRGRTALYGRRQLLQLVAIKRLQAQGRTLAEIQAELAGLSTEALEPIAALPAPPATGGPEVDVVRDDKAMIRTRFWTERNHSHGIPADAPAADDDPAAADEPAAAGESPGSQAMPTARAVAAGDQAALTAPPAPHDQGAATGGPTAERAAPANPPAPGAGGDALEHAALARAAESAATHDQGAAADQAAAGHAAAQRTARRRQAASARPGSPSTAPGHGEAADAGESAAVGSAPGAGTSAARGEAGYEHPAADDALAVQALRLADDVLLVLDHSTTVIDPDDVQALRDAAAPLLDALVRRGLVADHNRTKEPA